MNFTDTLSTLPRLPSISLRGPLSWLLSASIVALAVTVAIPNDVPITQLQVRGALDHVRGEDVRAAAGDQLAGSFFTTDLAGLRTAVAKLPWVAHVGVERVWPGALAVRVWERKPYARWNNGDLLDTESFAFSPRGADIPTGLPLLGGTAGHEKEVADAWRRIAPPLAETPFRLEGLVQDARGEWTARTTGGLELRLGQGSPDRHLSFLTGSVRRTLEGRWTDVQYVDLRYTNGFAVGWAKGAAVESRVHTGAGASVQKGIAGAKPAHPAGTEKR